MGMIRNILMIMLLMFAVPSVGSADEQDIVKCSWWGPLTAVGEDMDQFTAANKARAKARDGLDTIKNHLPDGWFVAGYKETHKWTRGKGGTHILTLTYHVKVCKWLPLPVPRRLLR